MNELLILLL